MNLCDLKPGEHGRIIWQETSNRSMTGIGKAAHDW